MIVLEVLKAVTTVVVGLVMLAVGYGVWARDGQRPTWIVPASTGVALLLLGLDGLRQALRSKGGR